MLKLRKLSGREIVAILDKLGFEIVRSKESHCRLEAQYVRGNCGVTIPLGDKPLPNAIIQSIYEDVSDCADAADKLQLDATLFYWTNHSN